jgi:hypothetical protein
MRLKQKSAEMEKPTPRIKINHLNLAKGFVRVGVWEVMRR